MMLRNILALTVLVACAGCAHQHDLSKANGMLTQRSALGAKQTVMQLERVLQAKGFTIFATIRHADGAASVGQTLRPTTVVVFGNPKVGTALMQCTQSAALDLPQKMLIHEDVAGDVWLTYNDPAYVFARHNIRGCDAWLDKVDGALAAIATTAAADQ